MYCVLRPCFRRISHLPSSLKLKCIGLCVLTIVILDFFGAFTHVFERTYDEDFVYPLEGNIYELVQALRHNERPAIPPINVYNYTFVCNNKDKCSEAGYSPYRVIYIVKSAAENFERRVAIRNTWGFENRFFDVPSKTIFLLGIHPADDELTARIKLEAAKHKDIVQADFVDSYYNNTIKTMMGFNWIVRYCVNAKFYMFVDDDMYVSVKNVLRFLRSPTNYPDYIREPKKIDLHKREIKQSQGTNATDKSNAVSASNISVEARENLRDRNSRSKRQVFDFELPDDVRLFTGYVFVSSPHRHKSSKWYVSLEEYPYHLWPPYVTAGAYILSKEALLDMYYTSFYTKHFRFDDIFLGLIAKKAKIEPFHCPEFHFHKADYTKFNYKYVITSHGYDDPTELSRVWNEQKALGNA